MIQISIDKEALAGLETEVFDGKIFVVDTVAKAKNAVAYLSKNTIIGFDTETRPSFKKGVTHNVALVQLSTMSECFLFRVNKIGLCEDLRKLLENSNITKIGLSIKDDFCVLSKVSKSHPAGFIDLQALVPKYGIKDASLQKIYGILFDKKISKAQRLSNWENEELTPAQMMYAAIDAWACLKIYYHLMNNKFDAERSAYQLNEEANEEVQKV